MRNIPAATGSHPHVERPAGNPFDSGSHEVELLQSGYRYALSLTHHRQDAEDLTQEAWVKLCRRYGRMISRVALYTTIRNLFIDRCRRTRVIGFDPLDDCLSEPASFENVTPGTLGDLDRLLGILRPGEREAIYLHYVEGHTAEEIGALTRRPRGTVLSLLHRALKKLRNAATAAG